MHTVVVTGTSRTRRPDGDPSLWNQICGVVRATPADTYISGGARGIDTLWTLASFDVWPLARRVLVVPTGVGAHWNTNLTNFVDEIIEAKPGRHASQSMMNRNDQLLSSVGPVSILQAFPRSPTEALRSGTWATVRRARKLDIPVTIFPLTSFLP